MKNYNCASPPVIFLGGIFTHNQTDYILKNSRGNIQNAADAFQKNIIRGLTENGGAELTIVNLPFIGSYPYLFSEPQFPKTREMFMGNIELVGMPFALRRPWKTVSRFLAAARGLAKVDTRPGSVILIYSAHIPFLVAALLQKLRKRDTRSCLILPDLPEFMDDRGRLYTMVKAIESRLFRLLAKRMDGFIILTEAIADRLYLDPCKYVVVEGIAAQSGLPESPNLPAPGKRIFLYTGTLASRYGVIELVDSFTKVRNNDAELWIAGDGDAKDHILEAIKRDPRIKFFGQVARSEAIRLQSVATVLVNPRRPEGEFTKYSFPSKTMEYMASGKPVIMFRLPGVPDEYTSHFIDAGQFGQNALQRAMEATAAADIRDLLSLGVNARDFVLTQKNAKAQGHKIIRLINSVRAIPEESRHSSAR